MSRLVLSGAILSTNLLMIGCQPPASGEAAGLSYPYLYWQLYKTPLAKNLNVPVEGVSHKQIQDTWGAARGQGRKHQGIDIFAKRGTPVLSATIRHRLGCWDQ